ncbi:MAG: (2Fe-2S)-binding protein [Pyrinomonadaceae bacterium]
MIKLTINDQTVLVENGASVAAAVLSVEAGRFRRSVSGQSRFPLCGMGICFECRVSINGTGHQRSCLILAQEGMRVKTDV